MQALRSTALWRALMMLARPAAPLIPPSLYSHLWFRGPFCAKVHGVNFEMQHTGHVLENQIFWRNTFVHEAGAVSAVLPYLRNADVMFDVGANTGFFSLLAKAVRPSTIVVAIEPSEGNFAILQRNIELNRFNISAVRGAATAESRMVTLFDYPAGISYSASLEAAWREGTVRRQVQGVTLDELADFHGVFNKRVVVKIDVEGHEIQVLRGARKLIESDPVFLIEIIRDHVAEGVRQLLPPGPFSYWFIEESTSMAEDATDKFAKGLQVAMGNYLVLPRGGYWTR